MPKDESVIVGDDMPVEKVVEEPIIAEPKPDPEPLDDKFKDEDARGKAYGELQTKFGEQGTELGAARAENQFLKNQIESQNQPDPIEDNQTDYQAEINEVVDQMDEGDISTGEGAMKIAEITALRTEAKTAKSIQQQQEQNIVDTSRNSFLEQHSDFAELQASGALEEVKNQLPGFHDDVSAYYEYKAAQMATATQTAIEAAKVESFEAGKAEMTKIAEGAENTGKVLQTPGGETAKKIGRENGPLPKNKMVESGLAALEKVRGG